MIVEDLEARGYKEKYRLIKRYDSSLPDGDVPVVVEYKSEESIPLASQLMFTYSTQHSLPNVTSILYTKSPTDWAVVLLAPSMNLSTTPEQEQ